VAGMKDALAPDIYSPGRGREAFQNIISRFRRPDAADPSATATERAPLPASAEDAFLPEATDAPVPAAPAPAAPVSSVPEEPTPSPEAPASATDMPEGVLFEPEEPVTWQGKGDYHYAYTPGDPDKGRPATITLHGGERGPVPITIREGGRNDRFFQAIMREYQELEQSRGLGQYIPARQYAQERPASTNEVVSTVAQDLVEQPTLPTPPAQASYGGEMAPGESPLSPEEMAPGESPLSPEEMAPGESAQTRDEMYPGVYSRPQVSRDDVVLGDFARQFYSPPSAGTLGQALRAIREGDYTEAIRLADRMVAEDPSKQQEADSIRQTARLASIGL